MEKEVHQNYINAADLILATTALGVINIFMSPLKLTTPFNMVVVLFTIAIMAGVAIMIKRGLYWAKVVYIVMFAIGLIGFPIVIKNLTENPFIGIINIIQTLLQGWAVILLLQIPGRQST